MYTFDHARDYDTEHHACLRRGWNTLASLGSPTILHPIRTELNSIVGSGPDSISIKPFHSYIARHEMSSLPGGDNPFVDSLAADDLPISRSH
jgi:hypothetical protein